jgi:uncharacterized damage-inducible protein DinB
MVSAEFATAFRDYMLKTMAQEKETSKRVFAAIPDARSDYRPDPKSRSAWELAWHVALEDVVLLEQLSERKFALPDHRYDHEAPKNVAELVDWYERRITRAMEKVRNMSADELLGPVDFLGMLKLPNFMYLTIIAHHSVHHRGQISTYLRPMGAKVPSIYGPSADTA